MVTHVGATERGHRGRRGGRLVVVLVAVIGAAAVIVAIAWRDPTPERAERVPAPEELAPAPPAPEIAEDPGLKSLIPTGLDRRVIPERFDIDWSRSGFWRLDMVEHVTSVSAERLETGFVDAYGLLYLTPDFAPSFFDTDPGSAGQDLVLMAILYDSPGAAGTALDELQRFDVWDESPADTGLAIAGQPIVRGSLGGLPTVGVTWRVGDLVLLAGAQGGSSNPSLPPPVVHEVAQRLDARAGLVTATAPAGRAETSILSTTITAEVPAMATCPEGSTPDEPGPADQARPSGRIWAPMAFDRQSGRIVLLQELRSGGTQTWTFDVCTNTWHRMGPWEPTSQPISARGILVYDADSDLTILFRGDERVWAYDIEADTWTKGEQLSEATAPQAVYDPVSGLVVLRGEGSGPMYAFDVETWTWTEVPQSERIPPTVPGPMHGQVMAYDPTVDRIVLFVEGHGCCPTTWLFDLRTGRWTRGNVETPTIEFVWGDLVNGGEIAFDASVGQVVIASGSERHGFDASVPGWKSQPLGLQRSFGVRLVYDAINERLVLLRDHAFLDGRWANPGDLVAWDVATEDWIELVPPLER